MSERTPGPGQEENRSQADVNKSMRLQVNRNRTIIMDTRSRRSFLRERQQASSIFSAPLLLTGKSRSSSVPDADKPFSLSASRTSDRDVPRTQTEARFDNIPFLADKGFRALFDNGLRPPGGGAGEDSHKNTARGLMMGPSVCCVDFARLSFVSPHEVRDFLTR